MKIHNIAVRRMEMSILLGVLALVTGLPSASGQFAVTYYDNYDNVLGEWDYWELGDIQRFWNDEYLVDFSSGNTEASAHYLPTVDALDLRTGFASLDQHVGDDHPQFENDDWTPLKSIGDPAWYGVLSPHHVFAAKFEGMIYLNEGDVLSLESDDDSYIFLDDNTAWDDEILASPGMHPFPDPAPSLVIPGEVAGFHTMTVKFADTHEVQCGIRITVNGAPLQAVLRATVRIEPETLNLGSKGVFTAFIGLADNHDVADIDVSTVQCAGAAAVKGTKANDTLIVKFNREDLQGVMPGDAVTLTVTGGLTDGRRFFGADTVRVIDPGAAPKSQGNKK